jgi:hypothetical protein
MDRVDGAALRVDVGELGKSSLLEIGVELVCMDKVLHSIFLSPLIHIGVNDIGLIILESR